MKKEMDFSRAFGRADERFRNCVETTLAFARAKEEMKVKKKLSAGMLAIALLLLLAMGTAFALSYHWNHIEKAMDLAVESGAYFEWSLHEKISLIEEMKKDGLDISEEEWQRLFQEDTDENEKLALADAILTRHYGDEDFLYYYTMAEKEWGIPVAWTLEQKHWFYQMERQKGLYMDNSWIDLLPEEGDMPREQAVEIARDAIMEAFDLKEEEMEVYQAGISFFITDTCALPRWCIDFYLPRENSWQTFYTVLLSREGEVTGDYENLGIRTPEEARKKKDEREAREKMADEWQIRGQKKLEDMESVYYNPNGGKNYHFLPDCPMVKKEYLPLQELKKAESDFQRLTPCPACVNNHDYWSLEDKILYGCGNWPMPEESWLSAEEAVEKARKALAEQGYPLEGLYPAVFSHQMEERMVWEVYFDLLVIQAEDGNVRIEPIYSVVLDAETGEILRADQSQSNG